MVDPDSGTHPHQDLPVRFPAAEDSRRTAHSDDFPAPGAQSELSAGGQQDDGSGPPTGAECAAAIPGLTDQQLTATTGAVAQEASFDLLRWPQSRTHAVLALAQPDRSETSRSDRAGRSHAPRRPASARVDL